MRYSTCIIDMGTSAGNDDILPDPVENFIRNFGPHHLYWSTPIYKFVRKNRNVLRLVAVECAKEIETAGIFSDVASLEIQRVIRLAEKQTRGLKQKMSSTVAAHQVSPTIAVNSELNFLSNFEVGPLS